MEILYGKPRISWGFRLLQNSLWGLLYTGGFIMIMELGGKKIDATYDEWEELYDSLEKLFGESAVEDNTDHEKLDQLDAEIFFDRDISTN